MPFSQHPWLPPAAVVFSGALPALTGLQFLVDPLKGLAILDHPVPTDDSSTQLTSFLVRYAGARVLTIGLMTFAVWRSGDRKTLGIIVILGTCMALTDGFIGLDVPNGQWKHWVFAPIGACIGGGLLGWFDSFL